MALARGYAASIPIIIRSLANSIAFVPDEKYLPYRLDDSVLHTLDAGEHQQVRTYHLQWWSGPMRKDLENVEILGKLTMMKCLEHFNVEKSKTTVLPAGTGAGPSNPTSGPSISLPAGTVAGPSNPTSGPSISTPEYNRNGCRSCPQYRQLLSDVLQDVVKFQTFADTMSSTTHNLLNVGIRRASTFNQLHEAAILKETERIPAPAKAKVAHRIAEVHRKASLDLKRLQELPVSSYKWTWGETLTEDDVLGLRRIGTRPGRVPHSGYDISLAEGRQGREDSEGANTVESSLGQHDEIPAEANISPPSTDLHLPRYLSQADHRLVYNPFRLSNSVLPNPAPEDSQSAPAPADNMETVEQWSSGTPSVHSDKAPAPDTASAIDVVDQWSSGSEDGGSPIPAPQENLAIAEMWSDEEDQEEHSGDELARPSYEASADLSDRQSGGVEIAEEWSDSEDRGDWEYGPGHFSFLRDDMFEESDDE